MSDELQAAEAAAATAKAAYRAQPDETTKAAYRAAAQELRYVRWVARGGPTAPEQKSTADLMARYRAGLGS